MTDSATVAETYEKKRLNAKDLIDDLQERAKENQKKSIEVAHKNNPNNKKSNRFSSTESNLSNNQYNTPVHENEEIAKLAGVSKAIVHENTPFSPVGPNGTNLNI
jgi:hypothetical protein